MTAVHVDTGGDTVDAERAERGLRRYVRDVAGGLGVGLEGVWCELAEKGGAYLALDGRLPRRPDRDVALVWDEQHGWAVGIETGSGEDLLIVAWYGRRLSPAPEEVVRFTEAVLAGNAARSTPPVVQQAQREALRAWLADYPLA